MVYVVIELHTLVRAHQLRLLALFEHRVTHWTTYWTPRVFAILMVLQKLTRRQATWVLAVAGRTFQYVLPKLLRNVTVRSVRTLSELRLAFTRVTQEQ